MNGQKQYNITERINILIGSDIHYAPYYGVMLTSLFMNNKESQFDVYLLTDSTWTEKETKKFEKLCGQYQSRFIVKIVDENLTKDFPLASHITLPTYYRLQAANLLPRTVHKVLYLDGDMIVLGDIRPLWNIDLTDMAFAGVEDESFVLKDNYTRLGYNEKYGYYNAGVSLYNLRYWRQNELSDKAIQFIIDNPNKIKWMDQDVVNAMLYNKRVVLPLKWNFQTLFLIHYYWDNYAPEFRRLVIEAANSPLIIHYCGQVKPWHFNYYGLPFEELWNKYYKLSPWRGMRKHTPISKYLKYLVKWLLFKKRILKARDAEYIQESRGL